MADNVNEGTRYSASDVVAVAVYSVVVILLLLTWAYVIGPETCFAKACPAQQQTEDNGRTGHILVPMAFGRCGSSSQK